MLAAGARGGENSSRGTVKVWEYPPKALDVMAQRSLNTFHVQSGGGIHLAFSPDGQTLAVGSDEGVNLLDVGTGENVATPLTIYQSCCGILARWSAACVKLSRRDEIMGRVDEENCHDTTFRGVEFGLACRVFTGGGYANNGHIERKNHTMGYRNGT